jgi:general secretion pathway protein G
MELRTVTGSNAPGKDAEGFTLIELLVVMVIIASLLTIAVPRYFKSIEHSREVVLTQDLSVLRDAIDKYFSDRGQYPQTLETLATERYVRKIPVDPITKSDTTWTTIESTDPDLTGIVDVHSGAELEASNGVPYSEW